MERMHGVQMRRMGSIGEEMGTSGWDVGRGGRVAGIVDRGTVRVRTGDTFIPVLVGVL